MLPFAEQGEPFLYSLVREAPLRAVISNTLGALFRSARDPHRQHHLTSPVSGEDVSRQRGGPSAALLPYETDQLAQPNSVAFVALGALPPLCVFLSLFVCLLRPLGSQDQHNKLENFGWLVGRCRDRPSRALPWTCPNVKNLSQNKKGKNKPETAQKIDDFFQEIVQQK